MKCVTKLKEYARGVRLDDGATKGVQGVNMNWAEAEREETEVGDEAPGGDRPCANIFR